MIVSMTAKSYRVRFELDESGWYAVTVPEVPGCITQAKTVPEGLAHARDALALLVGEQAADAAELLADVAGFSDPARAASG